MSYMTRQRKAILVEFLVLGQIILGHSPPVHSFLWCSSEVRGFYPVSPVKFLRSMKKNLKKLWANTSTGSPIFRCFFILIVLDTSIFHLKRRWKNHLMTFMSPICKVLICFIIPLQGHRHRSACLLNQIPIIYRLRSNSISDRLDFGTDMWRDDILGNFSIQKVPLIRKKSIC